MLVFSGEVDVTITRDRGQWDIAVAPVPGERFGLAVLIAAREDREWEPPAVDDSAGLPPQLPGGISWRDSLPTSIAWLRQPGSIDTLRRVNVLASARLRRQYGLD
jgi:hypothetical protein